MNVSQTMRTLTLVRHGQTQGTSEFRFTSQSGVPLSFWGRRQARLLGRRLAQSAHPLSLYSSDLQRAYETAAICGEILQLPVITHMGLREMDVGDWSSLTWAEAQQQFREDFASWQQDPVHYRRGGAESFADLQQRVEKTWREIESQCESENIILVCHAGTIRAFFSMLSIYDPNTALQLPVAHCAITTFTFANQSVRLLGHNDTQHLQREERRYRSFHQKEFLQE